MKTRYTDTSIRDIKKNGLKNVNILDRKDWRMAVTMGTQSNNYNRFVSVHRK